MSKIIVSGPEAQRRILSGAQQLAKVVGSTLGPSGRLVLVQKSIGAPIITKDGMSVARDVRLEDQVEDLACQIIKEVSGRTADVVGDGTTTATVLAAEILEGGMALMANGENPINFRNGINCAMKMILDDLESFTRYELSEKDLQSIATISANNDIELGSAIAGAFEGMGRTGIITAEARPGSDASYFRVTDGIEIRAGFSTPALLNPGEDPILLDKPLVLICDREITHTQDIDRMLNDIHVANRTLLIIAKDVKQEALNILVTNRRAGRLNAVTVKYPVFGKYNEQWLDDLAILVRTSVFSEDRGNPLSGATIELLGQAEQIKISRYDTVIVNGARNEASVAEKRKIYVETLGTGLSDSDRKDINGRLAFLQSKAAVVCVGYSTEAELREKGDRVEDAVCATKAAIDGGILPGGGTALLRAARRLDLNLVPKELRAAACVLKTACEKPFNKILENGYTKPAEILDQIMASSDPWFGYNLLTKETGNMLELGVVDPKKVTETALRNAVSAALLLINTDSVLAENPENPTGFSPQSGWRPPSDNNLNHKH